MRSLQRVIMIFQSQQKATPSDDERMKETERLPQSLFASSWFTVRQTSNQNSKSTSILRLSNLSINLTLRLRELWQESIVK